MSSSLMQERYERARQHCVLFHLKDRGLLVLEGADVRDFLNRLGTADVRSLTNGTAVQTLFLSKDGRLVADCLLICHDAEHWHLVTYQTLIAPLTEHLDRFLFTEAVTLTPVTDSLYIAMIAGARSSEFISQAREIASAFIYPNAAVPSVAIAPAAQRSFLILSEQEFQQYQASLYDILATIGGVVGDFDLYEALRIEDGIPGLESELTASTIPLESGQRTAISFTKGCYPGQEIIARIYNLGHPARVLAWVSSDGPLSDDMGKELSADGNVAGVFTSSAYSPGRGTFLGLAMLKWKHRLPGTRLTLDNREITVLAATDEKFAE